MYSDSIMIIHNNLKVRCKSEIIQHNYKRVTIRLLNTCRFGIWVNLHLVHECRSSSSVLQRGTRSHHHLFCGFPLWLCPPLSAVALHYSAVRVQNQLLGWGVADDANMAIICSYHCCWVCVYCSRLRFPTQTHAGWMNAWQKPRSTQLPTDKPSLSVHLISTIERTRFVDGDSTTHPPTSIQTHTEGGITTHTRPPLLRTNTPPRHDHKQLQHQSRGGEERETCFHQHQLFHSCRVTVSNNKVHIKSRSHH